MNKKLSSIICFILIVGAFVPAISIAFAGKPDKGPLEKKIFIHMAKPDKSAKPTKPDVKGKEWYKYSGIHWATEVLPVEYVVYTSGSGLVHEDVVDTIVASFETWDIVKDVNVFGDYSATDDGSLTFGINDGVNVVVWGDYEMSGVIAVTSTWYWRDSGEIVDVDTMFDTDYTWSLSGESGKMDLQNIATHEFGHWLVLDDLYKRPASEQTMYGYSTYGETSKQTLESGDKAGIQEIYGELADN